MIVDIRGCVLKEGDEVVYDLKSSHVIARIYKMEEGGAIIPDLMGGSKDIKELATKGMVKAGMLMISMLVPIHFSPDGPAPVLKLETRPEAQ